ncbi:MAG: alkaline phosphatase family protein [Planctomycetes bacterium]|nr:alkaline phosphatase family protein [Planctomycetota bacterium]
MNHVLRGLAGVLCAILLLLGGVLGATPGGEAPGRVVVLGFDGADSTTAERMMDAGLLPNLAKLREQGTYAPLGTTTPAESPVSWASLNSGRNPAKTGVSGFVNRGFDASGEPKPETGFYTNEARATKDMQLSFWQRFLVSRTPMSAAWILGVATALVFVLVLLLILRLSWWLALALALLLGAAGAWGGFSASRALPRSIEDIWANSTKAGGFWETAAHAGVPSVVIDGAMAWDRPEVPGAKVLSGLGVPDARGDYGSWCLYTTQDDEQAFASAPQRRDTGSGGRVFKVTERDGHIDTFLYGPNDVLRWEHLQTDIAALEGELGAAGLSSERERELQRAKRDKEAELRDIRNTRFSGESDEYRLFVPLTLTRVGTDKLEVKIGEEKQTLAEGQWSDWYHPRFDGSPLFQVHTVTRAKLRKLAEPLELVVDFLHFDPNHPAFYQPISQPPAFAGELATAIHSDYETVGWSCLTHGFKDGELDTRTFLEDIEFTQTCRNKLLLAALDRRDWKLLVDVESTPDRVQHMCYQYADPTHPLYDAAAAAETIRFFGEEIPFSMAIEASYRSMDRLVGEALAKLRPEDVLLVCSDHGFQSFRRQCHLNNWLAEHGYLALQPGLSPASSGFPRFVDWSKTKAYAMGLGMIFVNQAGREANGIVPEADVPALLERLTKDLLATEDDGHKAVRSVKRMAQIHKGPYLENECDLMVGFEAGWRVSWSTTLGNLKLVTDDEGKTRVAPVFSDNKSNWSGDHVSVSEDLVRGVFFSNRKVEIGAQGLDLLDVAPTALALLGVPIPADYDRPALSVSR